MRRALTARFGDFGADPGATPERGRETLAGMAGRASVRRFRPEPPPPALIRTLAAVALSAPTKSDLQQRDIVVVTDPALRAALDRCCGTQDWLSGAPLLLVFLGNHRRQRRLHEMRGHPFVNDHLDAFFNAAVDAAVALSAFVTAAEAAGLGCCPVSAIRNQPAEAARLLGLPDRVFPVAGLAVGWPDAPPKLAPRLPLSATLHENRFDESAEAAAVAAYDARRSYAVQRDPARFGEAADYGWSEDKARQYAAPERAGFGAYVRAIGFSLA